MQHWGAPGVVGVVLVTEMALPVVSFNSVQLACYIYTEGIKFSNL